MKYAVLLDFGSTYTKVACVDLDGQEVVLTDKFPSTVHSDAMINLRECFDAACRVMSETEFDEALKLSTSSAAGGLDRGIRTHQIAEYRGGKERQLRRRRQDNAYRFRADD
ncbi:MAG: glutamate mutase L [Anaerovoracaceae bacterium]